MTPSQEIRKYFGCRVMQRNDNDTTPLFIFHAKTKDVREWAGIKRIEESAEGTQRLLRETRRKAITRFLKADSKNVIPNNILLAFEPNTAKFTSLDDKIIGCTSDIVNTHNDCNEMLNWGFIEFSFNLDEKLLKPALIVDGQHRLYGISDFKDEDLPILIVSLLDATPEEQAFQFIVINNKAVRVSTDNVKSIIANLDETLLSDRLLRAGVKYGDTSPILRNINDLDSSPFYKLLDWPYNREGIKLVPLTAIEQILRSLRTFFPFLDDDEDSLFEIFCSIWMSVKNSYPNLWGRNNSFMTKVNINALSEFLTDRLKKAWEFGITDIFQYESVEKKVLDILDQIPELFWEQEWSIKIQDNANVRKMIQDDLETIVQNYRLKRAWDDKLQLPITNE